MKWLIIIAAITALVLARPEKYKEQEEFQYSRSSSDDGSKSGYYGAQRGNMGGNYERAHNMDSLAQHQMSGLVRQVEGELGDGAKMKTGSVFSAASSRGIYGSGRFDTSNLQGRNFQEGVSYDNSNLHASSMHSSASQSSLDYANRHSQSYGGYGAIGGNTQLQSEDLQSLDNLQTSNRHNYGSSRASGYQSQTGYQEQRYYDGDRTNSHTGYGSNVYTRLTPVKVIVTPSGRVALPVTAQVYDAEHGSSILNHNSLDSEVAATSDLHQGSVYRPGASKFYESSYKYNKKWEKHDTVPTSVSVAIPTESPIPKNSELYEDLEGHVSGSQHNARETDFRSGHSSSASGLYDATKLTSGQSRYNSNYNSQQYSGGYLNSNAHRAQVDHASSSDSLNAYTQEHRNSGSHYSGISTDSRLNSQANYNSGSQQDLNSQVEELNTKPKSYHSSYSYHKSWERQGDPYVIKPASIASTDSHTSQRLTSSTKNGYATYQPSYTQRLCEENCHLRVARSHGTDNQFMEQQSQGLFDDQDLGQRLQGTWKNLEDVGQVAQRGWDPLNNGQQSLSQWDSLKDLTQQSESNWDQQNLEQGTQKDNLYDLSQQSQNSWDQQNIGQQTQNNKDTLIDFTNQQTQNTWEQENVGQETQNHWGNLENLDQQLQSNKDDQNVEQQKTENLFNNLEKITQQSQSNWDPLEVVQQTQNQDSDFENFGQISQKDMGQLNIPQQNDKIENLGQLSQNSQWDSNNMEKFDNFNQQSVTKLEELGQQTLNQNTWDRIEDIKQEGQKTEDLEFFGQQSQNPLDQQSESHLYEQYAHKTEGISTYTNSEHSQPANEMKQERNLNFIWNQFDDSLQNNTVKSKEVKANDTDGKDIMTVTSYLNIDTPVQKQGNDSSDYGYSNGFINPFLRYNKNHLSNYDSTNSENISGFENVGNPHAHTYRSPDLNLQNSSSSQPNSQVTTLTNLWSKFDKVETALTTQTFHTDKFLITNESNDNFNSTFTKLNNSQYSKNQPWYVPYPPETSTLESTEYTGMIINTTAPNDIQVLHGENSETHKDIGRGDIGTEDFIVINNFTQTGSTKPYTYPSITVPQTTFPSPKHDNVEQILLQQNKTYTDKAILDDQLAVLSLQQQEEQKDQRIFLLTKTSNETANNLLQTHYQPKPFENDNTFTTELQNLNNNQTNISSGVSNTTQQVTNIDNWHSKTDITTEYSSINQPTNYGGNRQDQEIELLNSGNFDQESLNADQENVYNFGQEYLQVLPQQNENIENQYLQSFQDPLHDFKQHEENLEQQNLDNFGQEKVLSPPQNNKYSEQQTSGISRPGQVFSITESTKQLQHNSHTFDQETSFSTAQVNNDFEPYVHNYNNEQQLSSIDGSQPLEPQYLEHSSQGQTPATTQKSNKKEQELLMSTTQKSRTRTSNNYKNLGPEDFANDRLNEIEQDTLDIQNKPYFEEQNWNPKYQNAVIQSASHDKQHKNIETIGNSNTNEQVVNQLYEEVQQSSNLPRVQKSIGSLEIEKNLEQNEEDLPYVQQSIHDLGEINERTPLQPIEQNYAAEYEQSLERDFEVDFGQQHQTYRVQLEHSIKLKKPIEADKRQDTKNEETTSTTAAPANTTQKTKSTTTKPPIAKTEKVTEQPGFWSSVKNKLSSAKNKVVSWFKS